MRFRAIQSARNEHLRPRTVGERAVEVNNGVKAIVTSEQRENRHLRHSLAQAYVPVQAPTYVYWSEPVHLIYTWTFAMPTADQARRLPDGADERLTTPLSTSTPPTTANDWFFSPSSSLPPEMLLHTRASPRPTSPLHNIPKEMNDLAVLTFYSVGWSWEMLQANVENTRATPHFHIQSTTEQLSRRFTHSPALSLGSVCTCAGGSGSHLESWLISHS